MIFVAGGTGFVGKHLVSALLKDGNNVRCLARGNSKVGHLKELGAEIVYGNINDYASLEEGMKGAEKVIHLVGIIQESGKATFDSIHVQGTRNLLKAALNNNVKLFFYQSSLGADSRSPLGYHRTKGEADALVRESGLPYIIFRPSLIFGPGDQFTLRLSYALRLFPVFPVIGSGKAKFQPIYIDDLVYCTITALKDIQKQNRTFELGGPEYLTFTEIVDILMDVLDKTRHKVYIPIQIMIPIVKIIEGLIPRPPITIEQLLMLQQDNICDIKSVEKNFGFKPITLKEGIQRFLNPPISKVG